MITNLWQRLEHLSLHSNQSKLKQFSLLKVPNVRFAQLLSPWELLSPDTCIRQVPRGNPGEKEISDPEHHHAALREGLQQLGALTGMIPVWWRQHLLLSHRGMRCFTDQAPICAPMSADCHLVLCWWSVLVDQHSVEVHHSWPSCQEHSNPAVPTAYRPAPFNICFPTEMCHSMKLQLWVAQNPQARLCATRFHP